MELTLHRPGDHHFIRSFGDDGVTVTDTLYRESLVLSAEQLVSDWPVHSVEELAADHLDVVLELEPEVVLLGTGRKHAFPNPRLLKAFFELGVGFEAMTTEAACRTFNVLLSEGRKAVAALIID